MIDYELGSTPTPAQVRMAREAAGLTQEEAAQAVYARRRAWQNYESDDAMANYRPMPADRFELFLLKTGQLVPTRCLTCKEAA